MPTGVVEPAEAVEARLGRWRAAVVAAVVVLLACTSAAGWQIHVQTGTRERANLVDEAARIDNAIEQRMGAYVQVLRGGVGLFEASDDVTLDEWVRYVDTLQVQSHYPGFKSLTFAQAVPDAELAAFVADVRSRPVPAGMADPTLFTDFTPRPPSGEPTHPPLHAPILYVAPFTAVNQRVLGVDMMQEPTRRAAMEQAAATGQPVLSPRLLLAAQDDGTAGFIAYLPVSRGGHLLGWLTAAFRAADFMDALLGDVPPKVAFEIHDDAGALLWSTAPTGPDRVPLALPSSSRGRESQTTTVDLPGRTWSVRYVADPGFTSPTEHAVPWLVAAGGVLAALLVLAISRAGFGWRRQAARLAQQSAALRDAEAVVRHHATHDGLTTLPNRALFLDRLSSAVALGDRTPFAVAYLDLDGFKAVNDTYGHAAGDELLRLVAERLRARVRASDTVARLGGDEFAVLLLDGRPESLLQCCSDVLERLREPFALPLEDTVATVTIGASIGLARFPDDGCSAAELLAAADAAMYRAKRSGKDRFEVAQGAEPSVISLA